jgi:predicted  nucleic acid-binding Zn-ribbon protein
MALAFPFASLYAYKLPAFILLYFIFLNKKSYNQHGNRQPFMKKLSGYLLLLFSVSACNVKDSDDYKSVVSFNEYLQEKVKEKDKELEEITNAMARIESNLSAIRKQEGMIGALTRSTDTSRAGKIEAMFTEISTYLNENQKMMSELDERLKKDTKPNKGLTNLIAQQKKSMMEKEREIERLQRTIDSLQFQLKQTIATKNAQIRVKDQELKSTQKLLTEKEVAEAQGYYRFGSRKELLANGLILKEGGILGAGKSYKLSNNFDRELFKGIDTKRFSELELGTATKPKVLSPHPPEAYYFVKTDGKTYLKVTDQARFWSASRYLVIMTDN